MAVVGQALRYPETGWVEYDFKTHSEYSTLKFGIDNYKVVDSKFGDGTNRLYFANGGQYLPQYIYYVPGCIRFTFYGSDTIRIIGYTSVVNCSTNSTVTVNGVDYPINFNYHKDIETLLFELTGLNRSNYYDVKINFNDNLRAEVGCIHLKNGGEMLLWQSQAQSLKSFTYIL